MNDDTQAMSDDELANFRAAPWAVEAGLLVEVNGEVLITPKGFAVLQQMLEDDKQPQKRH